MVNLRSLKVDKTGSMFKPLLFFSRMRWLINDWERSTPMTLPEEPTISASSLVQYPGPDPKSRITSPNLNSARLHPLIVSDFHTLCWVFNLFNSSSSVPSIYGSLSSITIDEPTCNLSLMLREPPLVQNKSKISLY